MKKIAFLMAFCACAGFSCTSGNKEKCEDHPCKAAPKSQLRHVVMFKFKEGSATADVDSVVKAFTGLKGKIEQIKRIEWGLNNSPENLSQGFTHCFTLTFENETDRDAYLPHPEHKQFVEVLKPHLDSVLVFDYFAK